MSIILGSGTVTISVKASEYGIVSVPFKGLNSSHQILATSRPTHGGSGPNIGGNLFGPLYVPFVERKLSGEPHIPEKPTPEPNGFDILVYDIQANAFTVNVTVDWAVIAN